MLVLSRKIGESVIIDGTIRVVVLGVDGERVSVGFDAPRTVPIVRHELFDAVRAENLNASSRGADAGMLRSLGTVIQPPDAAT